MSETNLPKGCAVLNAEMAHVALFVSRPILWSPIRKIEKISNYWNYGLPNAFHKATLKNDY